MTPISNSGVPRRKEGTPQRSLQASKWLSLAMFIDGEEMRSLFKELGAFNIYQVSSVCFEGEEQISHETFLKGYEKYMTALQNGALPDDMETRLLFSAVFSVTAEALFAVPLEDKKLVLRVCQPVVQLQAHRIYYSELEKKFRSKVFGPDTISWGIQFSFPQLYMDGETDKVDKVLMESDLYPNTKLFQTIQKWSRSNTIPTPFIVDGEKINVPMRIGKRCLPWVNRHPQLIAKGIKVEGG